jgi:hypothetical protein
MPDDQEITPVEVITRHCRYTGSLATRGERVSDILSDANTDVLEMHETLTSVVGAGATDVRWKQIFLKKREILMVVPKGSYEAPVHRTYRYVEKPRYGAMVILPGTVMSGILHLPDRTNPLMLLNEHSSLPNFVGMTDVTMHNSVHGLGGARFEVVILQRLSIESLQLTAQPLPKQEAVGGTAEQGAPASSPAMG